MAEGDADDRIDAQGFRLALKLRPQMICTSLIDEMVVALANSRSSSRFCSADEGEGKLKNKKKTKKMKENLSGVLPR